MARVSLARLGISLADDEPRSDTQATIEIVLHWKHCKQIYWHSFDFPIIYVYGFKLGFQATQLSLRLRNLKPCVDRAHAGLRPPSRL